MSRMWRWRGRRTGLTVAPAVHLWYTLVDLDGLTETGLRIWRCDVTVELSKVLPQLEAAQMDVTIRVSAKLNVTQVAARRKVNVFLLNQIGTGLGGETPTLAIHDDRVCWRVPVILAISPKGRLGQAGNQS